MAGQLTISTELRESFACINMRRILACILLLLIAARSSATTYFVDGNLATGSNNGTSWANAWKTLGAMTGLAAGDSVQISGGATAGTCTYNFSDAFPYTQGSAGVAIGYVIGQDSAHNGTATFNQTSQGFSHGNFVSGAHDIIISGDAGDGGKHFKLSGTFVGLVDINGSNTNVRVAYFDLGAFNNIGSVNPGTKIEIDHINIKVSNDPTATRAIFFNIIGTAFDDSSIHDCTIQLPYNTTNLNFGPDGIKTAGGGASFYNNTISTYVDNTLTTTEHMDGIQALGGNFLKAYNNKITNMTNYGMYWEGTNAVFNHLWVYNNVVSVTDPTLGTSSSGGIVVEQKISGTMNDIVVSNNTIADLQPPGSRGLTMLSDGFGTYTNSLLVNNALVNCTTPETDVGAPTPSNNVNVTSANAATYFTTYVTYGGASNNFNLTAVATPLIGQALTESAYFTTDFAGVSRTAPWDVGAYKYTASGGTGGSAMSGKISLSGKVTIK